MSLRLGKELFDITQTVDTSASVPRTALAPSQSQPQLNSPEKPSRDGSGLTYLVQQHKRAFVLQAEATVTGSMALRPTGMQSETHRMLVRAVGQKHKQISRLKMTDSDINPEKELAEEIKRDSRKPRRTRTLRDDDDDLGLNGGRGKQARRSGGGGGGGGGGSGGGSSRSRRRRADDVFTDEEDEDEGGYSEEEYERSPKKAKGDERRGGEYMPDDFLVADSDEAGSDEDTGRKKKRRARSEPSDEDELDKLDAQIARQQAKKGEEDGGEQDADGEPEVGVEEDVQMDVESEEEDDDFKVRKAGATSAKKKRAFEEDDDDE
jgi:RNA polymerase-associated protein LEO1